MNLTEFQRRKDHFRHCPGKPEHPGWRQAQADLERALSDAKNTLPWHAQMNAAWVVCLFQGGAVSQETARQVLLANERVLKEGKPQSGKERDIIAALDGDEDLGSVMNYGRTLQEPMSRMALRARTLEVLDTLRGFLKTVLDVAEANTGTIMAGHTHFSHAQPITYAHYLLSVFDAAQRAGEQLALAYKHTNRNTGGCGSTSGTTWPVDRRRLTELLGFDELAEPTYDCEASHDHALSLLFASSNLALLASRTAMDLEIWTTEEFGLFDVDPGCLGQSSFMPHKAHPGSRLERTRIPAAEVLGEAFKAVCLTSSEPLGDVLPPWQAALGPAPRALAYVELCLRQLGVILASAQPKKDRMLRIAREGFSCSTEIVAPMVRGLGYGGRCAHRIVATFVRASRERGLKPEQTTGAMLDEAAEALGERPPRIEDATLCRLLDPAEFIKAQTNIGGASPQEGQRMIAERRALLKELEKAQEERKRRVHLGQEKLRAEVERITGQSV